MSISISKGNTKTGRIPAFSLPPIKSCPNCDACKKDCYALKAWRQYPGTRKAWQGNLDAVQSDLASWESEMISRINRMKAKFFRIHVSGDFFSPEYYKAWTRIARACPSTRFLAFTKAFDNIRKGGRPTNLTIVHSSFPGMAPNRTKFPIAYTYPKGGAAPVGAKECPGNCETCGACWYLKAGEAVAFEMH